MTFLKKAAEISLGIILFLILTLVYLFPLTQGLVLLPLDLLVTHYPPWAPYYISTILVKNPFMQDSVTQMFPWKYLLYQSFAHHIIPFWNPYQFLGAPFMASMKPTVFYPLNLLYIFGPIQSWNILLFSQVFLAFFFTFLLARDFKIGKLPSLLVSIAYSLNTLMMTSLEFGSEGHVLLWFPVFFLCAKRYLKKQKGRYLFFLGLALAMSIFAGQLQFFGYGFVLLLAFIIFYGRSLKTRVRSYVFLFLSIILGVGISAVQLGPSLELFQFSHRGNAAFTLFLEGLAKPYHLLLLLIPDAYGNPVSGDLTSLFHGNTMYFGIIPLFFCLSAIIFLRKNFFVKFFSVAFVTSLLFTWDVVGRLIYWLKIPLFTSGSADRILSLMLFSGAILAGFGLFDFTRNDQVKRKIISIAVYLCSFLVLSLTGVMANKILGKVVFIPRSIAYPLLILAAFSVLSLFYLWQRKNFKYLRQLFLLGVVALTFFDLFRMGYRYLTFSNEKFLYPDLPVIQFIRNAAKNTLARSFGLEDAEIPSAMSLYSTGTYNPLYLTRTGLLLNTLQQFHTDNLPNNNTYYLSNGQGLKHALDFLGVSYVSSITGSNASMEYFQTYRFEKDLKEIWRDDRYQVYQNITAYPRFGLYYQMRKTTSDRETLSLISQNAIDLKKKLLLEESLPFVLRPGTGSSALLASDVNSEKFLVRSTSPGLFYISDTYFPGWSASVNGNRTKIYRANYNFRAVAVPAGKSIVEFNYLPSYFEMYIEVSILSFLTLFGIGYFQKILNSKVYKGF
jgi:hypothetical protein